MYYCKLYIDSSEERPELQEIIDRRLKEYFQEIEVEAPVFDNENFTGETDHRSQFYPIERSRFYVEVDSECTRNDLIAEFQQGIARLVQWLREGGRFVVASCEFEDLIVSETGWNWTPETPVPPA